MAFCPSKSRFLVQHYLLLFGSVFFIGCATRLGGFTVISTRNSNVKNWKRAPERVEGSSCRCWLFFFPAKDSDLKDAIEDAVDNSISEKKIKGLQSEALLDVKLSTNWFSLIFITRSCLYAVSTPADSWYGTEERQDQIETPKYKTPK